MPKKPHQIEGSQDLWKHGRLAEGEECTSRGLESLIVERNFGYVVVHFIPREKTGDIRRGGGAGKANEFDVDIRVTFWQKLGSMQG